jgi:hypothetical protein
MAFNFENFEDNLKIKLFWDYLDELVDYLSLGNER